MKHLSTIMPDRNVGFYSMRITVWDNKIARFNCIRDRKAGKSVQYIQRKIQKDGTVIVDKEKYIINPEWIEHSTSF